MMKVFRWHRLEPARPTEGTDFVGGVHQGGQSHPSHGAKGIFQEQRVGPGLQQGKLPGRDVRESEAETLWPEKSC